MNAQEWYFACLISISPSVSKSLHISDFVLYLPFQTDKTQVNKYYCTVKYRLSSIELFSVTL